MADEKRSVEYELLYNTNQSSLNSTIQGTNRLAQSVEAIPTSLGKLGLASENNLSRLRRHFGDSEKAIQTADQAAQHYIATLEDVGNTIKDLPDPSFYDLTSPIPGSGGGRGSGKREQTGLGRIDQTGRIGTQILSGLGQGELGNTIGLLGDLAGGIEDVGLATTLTLGGIGLLGAGLGVVVSEINRVSAALEHEIDVRFEVQDAIRNQTTEQAQAVIREKELQQQIAQDKITQIEAERDAFANRTSDFESGGVDPLAYIGSINTYNNQIAEQQKIVDNTQTAIDEYNAALDRNATGLRDATAALKEGGQGVAAFAQVSTEDVKANLEARTQANLAAAEDARQLVQLEARLRAGSSKSAEDYYHQLEVDSRALVIAKQTLEATGDTSEEAQAKIAAYDAAIGANADLMLQIAGEIVPARKAEEEATRQQTAALNARIAAVDRQIQLETQSAALLRSGTVEQVDDRLAALNAERQAIINNIGELQQLAPTSQEAADRLASANTRLGELSTEIGTLSQLRPDVGVRQFREEVELLNTSLTESIQKLTAARNQRLGDLATQLEDGLEDLQEDFVANQTNNQDEANDQILQFNQQELQRAREHQNNLARIMRDSQQQISDMAADGNIRGALEAERAAANQLEDAQDNFDLESERRSDELDELKDNISDQERERVSDYQRRYNELIENNQRQVAAVNAKYQADVSLQQQAYQVEYTNLQNSLINENALRTQANNAMLEAAGSFVTGMIERANSLLNSLASSSSSSSTSTNANTGSSGLTATAFAGGGAASPNRLSQVNDDVFNRTESGLTRSGRLIIFGEQTQVLDGNRTQRLLAGDTSALPGGAGRRGGDDNSVNLSVGNITVTDSGDPQATAAAVRREILTNTAAAVRQQAQTRRAANQGRRTA